MSPEKLKREAERLVTEGLKRSAALNRESLQGSAHGQPYDQTRSGRPDPKRPDQVSQGSAHAQPVRPHGRPARHIAKSKTAGG